MAGEKASQFGPCGLCCGACGATDCGGCRSDLIDDHVRSCAFRKCAIERSVDSCAFCADYPCPTLHVFMNDQWPHHHTIGPNIEYIRTQGLEKWLEARRREWTCANCGAEIKWYEKACPCGQALPAWELPA